MDTALTQNFYQRDRATVAVKPGDADGDCPSIIARHSRLDLNGIAYKISRASVIINSMTMSYEEYCERETILPPNL